MKKTQLRQLIREEIKSLNEANLKSIALDIYNDLKEDPDYLDGIRDIVKENPNNKKKWRNEIHDLIIAITTDDYRINELPSNQLRKLYQHLADIGLKNID